jgi:cytochrome c-type biogenesis protein CcmH/NrfG
MYQHIVGRFHAISFSIIIGICFLLPFFFLPATVAGLGSVKGVLLYVGVLLAFSLWIVAQFIEGSFKIPKNAAFAAMGVWILAVLISALMSANTPLSLWGRGFVIDSFATTLILSIFAFLVAVYAREQRKLIKLFLGAFAGSVLTVLLQVLLFVFGGTPFVSEFFGHVARQGTLVGSWVDFAHFVTFTFLLALLMHEVLSPRGFFRFLSLAAMVLSIIALAFLNFKAAWIITIIAALLVFVYKSSVERSISRLWHIDTQEEKPEQTPSRFPLMSFIALLVGLFFFLSSSSIGSSLANLANINFADIRPSFSSTMTVTRATLAQDPIFGAGAGRFADVWNLYHPIAVNQTAFWNTSFDSGYGWLWTHATTNGPIAALLLLAMIILAIVHGVRLFNATYPDRFTRFIAVTALIMLIAFAALILFASPGMVLILYGFMYLGMLVGVSTLAGRTKLATLNYLRDPRMSFFAILLLVVTAMVGFSAVYFAGTRFASVVAYNRAITATSFESAERRINRAISYSSNDIFLRARAALYTSQFGTIAAQQNPDRAALQTYFSAAEQSAQAALAWDNSSASNWLVLSQVYRLVVTPQSADAYNTAKVAADEAQKRNPNNPSYALNQAQLALSHRDNAGANAFIDQALQLKSDYLDAYVLRAQIRSAQGNTQAARDEIANYTRVAPFDAQGYVLLGNTEVELRNFQSALDAFARARQLSPNNPTITLSYVNALVSLGRRSDAIAELEQFKARYPQVQGVQEQIDRLRAGVTTSSTADEDDE